jgi:molybdopterin-guanine dinucleotide biosynthesis protein A
MRREEVTAIVLCGGTGTRLGGTDKPLALVDGHPLVAYVLRALEPQVGGFVLACGRDPERYEALGLPTAVDFRPGDGPLGGIVSALAHVSTEWILTHPADVPFADAALVSRLAPVAEAAGVAVPRGGGRRQNLVLLLSRQRADELARYYRDGGRAVRHWLDDAGVEGVDMSDVAESFFNVNTVADLRLAEERLAALHGQAKG